MTVSFRGQGNTTKHTPSGADVLAGDVVVVGLKVFVAKSFIADGIEGEVNTNGEYEWPKDNSTAFAQGIDIFWDVADQEATEDDDTGTNKYIGYTTLAAADTDTTLRGYLVNNT